MTRKSLDNILSEDTGTEMEIRPSLPETDPEPGVQSEETEPQPRDERGKFAPKEAGEPKAEPPSALPKDVYEPLRAVRDENKTLKEQLEALRREIQQPKEPPAPPPSMWEDDQAWQQHFGGQVVSAAVQQASFQNKLATSEFYARKNIEGFEQEWQSLNQWLVENPAVAQQASADYDPWGFAFRAYKNQRTMQELGATDIDQLKAQIRVQVEAEMAAQRPATPNIPPSLSNQRSVSGRTGPAWAGPKPLNELL
jgi:hypothetical protein